MTMQILVVLLTGMAGSISASETATPAKLVAVAEVDARSKEIIALGRQIWESSELAFQEFKSSSLLADTLESNGFRVRRGVAGMKTAFVAEYGAGKPVIAVLAEFDALPGLSQAAEPLRKVVRDRDAGHGCGHNLFGAASTGAVLAVKKVMEQSRLNGTIRLYGCPAEEGGGGKTYMVRDGLFNDVDVALHWHPSTRNDARMRTCLAVIRFRVRFRGKSAHAAGSPHMGRSAMDGVELMNVGTNYLREHIISQARIHYVVTDGGRRPNVVPELAEVWYYIRAPKMDQAREIFERVKKIAQGAALMSETAHELRMLTGTYELLVNETLARTVDRNLRWIGPPPFTDEDRRFASKLRSNLGIASDVDLRSGDRGPISEKIVPFGSSLGLGSTDVGDVSWAIPTAGFNVATAARGVPGHSWSFVACSGAKLGQRASITAAKVLAATAVELLERPEIITGAKREFQTRKAGTAYRSPNGDEPPPDRLDAQ